MAINAKQSSMDFELCPEDSLQAICIAVYDLGYQKGSFKGVENIRRKVAIRWEVNERMKREGEYKGKRFNITRRYTLSLNKSASLRKDLESWRGKAFADEELKKGFDLEKLVGINCFLSIIHDQKEDKTYVRVNSVTKLPKGLAPIVKETDTTEVPKWIQEAKAQAIPPETMARMSGGDQTVNSNESPF